MPASKRASADADAGRDPARGGRLAGCRFAACRRARRIREAAPALHHARNLTGAWRDKGSNCHLIKQAGHELTVTTYFAEEHRSAVGNGTVKGRFVSMRINSANPESLQAESEPFRRRPRIVGNGQGGERRARRDVEIHRAHLQRGRLSPRFDQLIQQPKTGTGGACAPLSEILPSARVARFVRMTSSDALLASSG